MLAWVSVEAKVTGLSLCFGDRVVLLCLVPVASETNCQLDFFSTKKYNKGIINLL